MIASRLSVPVCLAWEVVRLDGSQHGSQTARPEVRPGQPWRNGYIESFNSPVRGGT